MLDHEAHILKKVKEANIPNTIQYVQHLHEDEIFDDLSDQQKLKIEIRTNRTESSSGSTSTSTSKINFGSLENIECKSALILEYAQNYTLFEYLYYNGGFEEKLARTYFRKVVNSINALHDAKICHRDLKTENILLDEKYDIKICDFGFAKEFNDYNRDRMSKVLGTEGYMAPEIEEGKRYDGVKADVFSLGVLLFLFAFGRPPFFKASPSDPFFKYIYSSNPEKFWDIYEEKIGQPINKELKELIQDLLIKDSTKRPETKKILEYSWLQGEIYTEKELQTKMSRLRREVDAGLIEAPIQG